MRASPPGAGIVVMIVMVLHSTFNALGGAQLPSIYDMVLHGTNLDMYIRKLCTYTTGDVDVFSFEYFKRKIFVLRL